MKPVLIYDGECPVCRRLTRLLARITKNRLELAPASEAAARFPQIPRESYQASMQLVAADGSVSGGSQALFHALACRRGFYRAGLTLYRRFPSFARQSERIYSLIAKNRMRLCPRVSRYCVASYPASTLSLST